MRLIRQGDEIQFINGQLKITPNSGKSVPNYWMKKHENELIESILNLFDGSYFRYAYYKTGNYGVNKAEGISLQYLNVKTNEENYVIFNAKLTKARNTSSGVKGSKLTHNKFRVSENMGFYKFWCTTSLKLPQRLSAFHDCMGKLKPILISGEVGYKGKIINKTLKVVNISFKEILDKIRIKDKVSNRNDVVSFPDNNLTSFRQIPNNIQTTYPDKDVEQGYTNKRAETDTGTCHENYGNKYIRGKFIPKNKGVNNDYIRDTNLNDKAELTETERVRAQTNEEWLAEYERS
jgi:hypothetical protein